MSYKIYNGRHLYRDGQGWREAPGLTNTELNIKCCIQHKYAFICSNQGNILFIGTIDLLYPLQELMNITNGLFELMSTVYHISLHAVILAIMRCVTAHHATLLIYWTILSLH